MTFRFTESRDSRSSSANPPSYVAKYTAAGTNDASFVRSYAIAATPNIVLTTYGTLWRQDIALEPAGFELWKVSVPYGPHKFELGDYRLTFDTTGGTIKLKYSNEQWIYGTNAPDMQTLINCKKQSGAFEVEGCDKVTPALKITVVYKHPAAIITIAQIKQLAYYTGVINSATFMTFSAGEVLFLGASGDEGTDAETSVQYQFAIAQNKTGMTIGDIANIAKRGHDFLWVYYWDKVDAGYLVPEPQGVYVERIYEEADLRLILGFG